MHLSEMILHWAQASPNQPAIVLANAAWTYHDLARAIVSVSDRLDVLNLNRKEPVAVTIPQPHYRLAVCVALLGQGFDVASVSRQTLPFLKANGINTIIDSGEGPPIVSVGRSIRFSESWFNTAKGRSNADLFARPNLRNYGKTIFFTSGTTGVPTVSTFPHTAISERVALRPISGEFITIRALVVPALSSAFGFLRTAELLYSGKTVCYGGDPSAMLRMIDLFDIETIIASPHQLLAILDRKEREPSCETHSLREVIIGGGYVSPKLFSRIQASLCRPIVYNYGSTEAGLIALGRYDNIKHAANAVGFPVPGAAVEIVDDANNPLPAGTEGRVRCRTNYFLSAYLDRHPEQSHDIENVWWITGDLGRITEDGILCIHGRADDVVNLGGVKISGAMLDEMIQGIPGVEDAGVCAVPGDTGIVELWVGVIPQPGVSIAAIREHILRIPQLQQQQIEIFVINAVPRTDLGKIARGKMREGLLKVRQPAP